MKRIETLIVDDEALARERLREGLAKEPDFHVCGECPTGLEAVGAIEELAPDLVFLDVQMPGLDGFGVLEALSTVRVPAIVFVTAYDQYALKAFEVHALDYLLKPFDRARFRDTLDHVRERIGGNGELARDIRELASELRRQRDPSARFAVKSGGRITLVATQDIDWIEAAGNYVRLHCGEHEHLLRGSLTMHEQRLDPDAFVRIHRSTIVRIDRIQSIEGGPHGDCRLWLATGTELSVSRSYRDALDQLLDLPRR